MPEHQSTFRRRSCSRCACPYEGDEIEQVFTKHRRSRRVAPDRSGATAVRRVGETVLKDVCSPCTRFGDQVLLTAPWGPVKDEDCLNKADTARRNHRDSLGIPVDELRDHHGWETRRIAHAFAHAADNRCPYCEVRFRLMHHGLGELTVDIIDPSLPPTWGTNTTIACRNCNSAKRRRTREQ